MAKKAGRKSKFSDTLAATMLELYKKGKTDAEVADIIGVAERTIRNWKGAHPTFLPALKEAKQIADNLVEASLFSRAVGYSHPEEKVFQNEGQIITHNTIKQYPPDPTAAIFWLKNRQPKRWRDKLQLEHDVSTTLAERLARARQRIKR